MHLAIAQAAAAGGAGCFVRVASQDALCIGEALDSAVSPGKGVKDALARGHRFITMGIDTRLLGQAMAQQLAECPGRVPMAGDRPG